METKPIEPAPLTLEELLGRTPEERQQQVVMSVRDLRVHYPAGGGTFWDKVTGGSPVPQVVKAVDGVSLDIYEGESLGLVGESGCGKSTLGRAMLRLTDATEGNIFLRNNDLTALSSSEMREWRRHLQMIFQDPYASLNPRMTVGQIVKEPLETFNLASGQAADRWVQSLLEMVGLSKRFVKRYPHEFSGGQRQRIGIARALAASPDLIVADEPISALDVSIQAQIMNLLKNLQKQKSFACLFISHDLRAVRHFSDRIAVMYLGRIVEIGKASEVYEQPLMPYTQALISAVPVPDPEVEGQRLRLPLKGEIPSALNPPPGCHFHPRCPHAIDECSYLEPELKEILPGHFAACLRISREQPFIAEAGEFVANLAQLSRARPDETEDPAERRAAAAREAEERRRAHEEAILQQKETAEAARLEQLAKERRENEERERREQGELRRVREVEEDARREQEEQRRRAANEEEHRRIEEEQAAIRAEQENIRQLEAEARRREAEEAGRRQRAAEELEGLRQQAEEAERLRQEAEAAVRRAEEERLTLLAQTATTGVQITAEAAASQRLSAEETARRAVEARLRQMESARRQREEAGRLEREDRERRLQEEQERLQREEEIKRRQLEIERLLREGEERRRQEEIERLRLEEEDRLRLKAEEEARQREEEERLRREEEERLRREEEERRREIAAEQERERLRREEEDRQRELEAERLKQEEAERLRLQAAEEAQRRLAEEARQRAEEERLRLEEEERLRRVEEEVRRQQEEERLRLEAEDHARLAEQERLRAEQERLRWAEEERRQQEELAQQQKLAAERERLEEERRLLAEARHRAEAGGSAALAPPPEDEEKQRLLAEVERLKREAEEALRRQREAEAALRQQKSVTGELDRSILARTMPDYVQPTSPGYVPPEAAPERTVTEADRAAAVAAPTTDAPLFGAYQPPPARVRRASGLGLALLGLLALALIGAVFIFARFLGNRTGSQQAAPPTAAPTPTPNVGPQSPPAGMVYVPGGAFKMGRNDGDDYEKPAHDVTVRPFFMDIYEVTNEDYAKFVAATQHKPPPGWKNGAFPEGAGRKPVTGVNFDDAGAYAAWAGKRLPTEEEWEFAARGADGRLYPWGGDKWDSKTRANANAATRPPGLAEIGAYPDGASPYGVQDLAGNAWEWTSSPLKAYEGGELPEAPAADAIIIRGGCYLSGLDGAAVTYRGWVRKTAEKSYAQTGIRCVKDLP